MKQIVNKDNRAYAEKCFQDAVKLGINFKLNNKVNESHFKKEMLNELLDLPLNESTPEEILIEFKEKILPYCTNFHLKNLWAFQMLAILFLVLQAL